jgi:hypothetical protein
VVSPPYRTAASSASEALASEAPPPLPCSRPSWQLKNASGGKHASLWNGAFLHNCQSSATRAPAHANDLHYRSHCTESGGTMTPPKIYTSSQVRTPPLAQDSFGVLDAVVVEVL